MSSCEDFDGPVEREVEIDAILLELEFSKETRRKFKEEKVFLSTVPLLTDQDLIDLGVTKVGDRAVLRKKCRDSVHGKNVTSEVRRVMGPSTLRVSYDSTLKSLSPNSPIPRKPKRYSKLSLATTKYGNAKKKGRLSSATFQKKLVVFRFMPGSDSIQPKSFTRADKIICVRGLLPSLMVESSESEIRGEICEVMRSATSHKNVSPDDFEFINMSGKQASVPQCKEGFEWNGRAVKELAGSGSIYVRLLRDIELENRSDEKSSDSEELPSVIFSYESPSADSSNRQSSTLSAPLSPTNISSITYSSSSSYLPILSGNSTTSNFDSTACGSTTSDFQRSFGMTSSSPNISDRGRFDGASTSSAIYITDTTTRIPAADSDHHGDINQLKDIAKLAEMFTSLSDKQLKYVYNLSHHSFTSAMDSLIDGPSMDSLRSLLRKSQITVPDDEGPRIRLNVDDDEEDWMEAAFCFYKHAKFDKNACIRVSIRGQPAIDTGGVRRQFFSVIFSKIASPSTMQSRSVFEGPPNRLRPSFKASVLSSGMLKTIGMMIAHSVLLDGQGFPFLADYCYYYIADCYNLAVTCITEEDVGARVKSIITEIEKITDFSSYERLNDLMELIQESGCDLPLTVTNKAAIMECILLHNALHKLRVYLDDFARGLDSMGVKEMIILFPHLMKPFFVYGGATKVNDVLKMMRPDPPITQMDQRQLRVWQYLLAFINVANEKELKAFLQFITGSPACVGLITVTFTDGVEAISANTCGRQLTLSTNIEDCDIFMSAIKVVIDETSFTML